jgi:hypothetical protein
MMPLVLTLDSQWQCIPFAGLRILNCKERRYLRPIIVKGRASDTFYGDAGSDNDAMGICIGSVEMNCASWSIAPNMLQESKASALRGGDMATYLS